MSSRLPTRSSRRSVSSSMVPRNSRVASSVQSTSRWRRLVTDALIDANGVRRSWDTARSSDTRSSSALARSNASSARSSWPAARAAEASCSASTSARDRIASAARADACSTRTAHERADDEEDAEGERVLPVRDGEPVERRGEEPVGAQGADHRGGDGRAHATDRRDDDHEQQVEEQLARQAERAAQVGQDEREQRNAERARSASR